MTLTIHHKNGCKQRINLHESFFIEKLGKDHTRRLSILEIEGKAKSVAMDLAGDQYHFHTLFDQNKSKQQLAA